MVEEFLKLVSKNSTGSVHSLTGSFTTLVNLFYVYLHYIYFVFFEGTGSHLFYFSFIKR